MDHNHLKITRHFEVSIWWFLKFVNYIYFLNEIEVLSLNERIRTDNNN